MEEDAMEKDAGRQGEGPVPASGEESTEEFLRFLQDAEEPGQYLLAHRERLFAVIPELAACDGYDQRSIWHQYTLLEHMTRAVDAVQLPDGEDRRIVRLAALLHDIGKPRTFRWDSAKQTAHFYGHPEESVRIIDQIFRADFREGDPLIDPAAQEIIRTIVLQHENRLPDSERSARKLIARFGAHTAVLLLELQKADTAAHGEVREDIRERLRAQYADLDRLQQRIRRAEAGEIRAPAGST